MGEMDKSRELYTPEREITPADLKEKQCRGKHTIVYLKYYHIFIIIILLLSLFFFYGE